MQYSVSEIIKAIDSINGTEKEIDEDEFKISNLNNINENMNEEPKEINEEPTVELKEEMKEEPERVQPMLDNYFKPKSSNKGLNPIFRILNSPDQSLKNIRMNNIKMNNTPIKQDTPKISPSTCKSPSASNRISLLPLTYQSVCVSAVNFI